MYRDAMSRARSALASQNVQPAEIGAGRLGAVHSR